MLFSHRLGDHIVCVDDLTDQAVPHFAPKKMPQAKRPRATYAYQEFGTPCDVEVARGSE
jgi:hypothetical protein